MYSFVGRRSTIAETTAAAAAHLGVTTYMFFLIVVHVTFLRVLYNNIHHHIAFAKEFSYDPLSRGFFFLGKPRKERLASLARLTIITLYYYKLLLTTATSPSTAAVHLFVSIARSYPSFEGSCTGISIIQHYLYILFNHVLEMSFIIFSPF